MRQCVLAMLALTALLALLADSWYFVSMATLTIRNLDETVKRKLQVRAALNGRSMEAEVRELLSHFIEPSFKGANMDEEEDFGTAIRKHFAPLGEVELQIPPRVSSSQQEKEAVPKKHDASLSEGLGTAIHKLFAPLGGVELEIPHRRKSHRQIPTFD